MSRIGRMPIVIPSGVEINIKGSEVTVKGPKGQMKRVFSPSILFEKDGNQINVKRESDEANVRALHGTTRAVLNNMVVGVSTGFTKILEVNGVGYRVEMEGDNAVLHIGYSHPVPVAPPTGISFEVDPKTHELKVNGYDVEVVGQVASDIRKLRPPEPYHGKGIRYKGEIVRRKAGKSGKA